MAATRIWTGAGAGGDPAHADSWSPAGPPVSGDELVFLTSSVNLVPGASQALIVCDKIYVSSQYVGNIGATGDPWDITSSVTRMESAGAECWLSGIHSFGYFAPVGMGDNACQIGGALADGTAWIFARGKSQIVTGTTYTGTNLFIDAAVRGNARSPHFVVPTGVTFDPTTKIQLFNGFVENSSSMTFLDINGGVFVQKAGTLTTVLASAAMLYLDGGTIGTLIASRGQRTDASRTSNARTLTNYYGFGQGTLLDLRNGAGLGIPGFRREFHGAQTLIDVGT